MSFPTLVHFFFFSFFYHPFHSVIRCLLFYEQVQLMHVEYKIYFLRNHDAGCVIGHAIATNVPARCCRAKRQFTHFGLLEQQETKESCINPGKTIMATENGHKSIFFSGAIFSSLSLVHVLSTKCSVLFVEDRIKFFVFKRKWT